MTFQMAEVAVLRQMFADILFLIARLRAPPRARIRGRRDGKALIAIAEVPLDGGKATSSSVPARAKPRFSTPPARAAARFIVARALRRGNHSRPITRNPGNVGLEAFDSTL